MLYDLECGLSWWIFHVNLRTICLLLLLDEVLYKCQIKLIDVLVQYNYTLAGFSHYWKMVLKLTVIILGSSIFFSYSSIHFCLMYFGDLLLGAYTLILLCLPGELTPLTLCIALSLFLINFLVLMSALLEDNMATPAFFWLVLAWRNFLHPL